MSIDNVKTIVLLQSVTIMFLVVEAISGWPLHYWQVVLISLVGLSGFIIYFSKE